LRKILRKISLFIIPVLLLTLSITGCGADSLDGSKGTVKEVVLTVSAASSLTDVIEQWKQSFEQQNQGIKIVYSLAGSGTLQRQIEQGAPVDLFISANQNKMDQLDKEGLIIKSSRKNILKNSLVMITNSTQKNITKPEDLLLEQIKYIALGDPKNVPAGNYGQKGLEKLGLWSTIEPKLVFTKDVRQVLTYVESNNADIGIVYSSDIKNSERVKVIYTFDKNEIVPITYPIAIVSDSKHTNEASKFIEFILSYEGQQLLKESGFQSINN